MSSYQETKSEKRISQENSPCFGRDLNRGHPEYETLPFESRGLVEGYGGIKEETKQRKKQKK
jgi:hypothetical protein